MNCSFLVLMDFRCLFFLTVALLVAFLSFLFVYRQYLKDLSSLVTPEPSGPSGLPRLVCGCKGRTFFFNRQTFSEVFLSLPKPSGRGAYLSKAGAKVALSTSPSKLSGMFFSVIFDFFCSRLVMRRLRMRRHSAPDSSPLIGRPAAWHA